MASLKGIADNNVQKKGDTSMQTIYTVPGDKVRLEDLWSLGRVACDG